MLLDVLKQRWAGALGGAPAPGSPLERDLHASPNFASARLPDPFSQSWAFSQTLGLVATNHEAILRESLLNYASSQTFTLPVTVVTTLARVILETLSVQAWLIEPTVDSRGRLARWMALEFRSERAAWTTLHPGVAHMNNPIMQQLVGDADALGIHRDPKTSPEWIGVNPPRSTTLAGKLLQRYSAYANTGLIGDETTGERFYRLFSGEMHGTVGNVLQLLLATGTISKGGHPVHAYGLTHGALWRAVSIVLMSTFTARCVYADWLGFPVDAETRRLHTHHVGVAIQKLA